MVLVERPDWVKPSRWCVTHEAIDSDGDRMCGTYACASPKLRRVIEPCIFEGYPDAD